MNKKALYWIVGIIIVVAIAIALMSNTKSAGAPAATAPGNANPAGSNQTAAGAMRQSMHDLIASGATQTCTFSIPATATSSSMSGSVYMAHSDMRGDFVTTSQAGKATNSHMIINSGTVYLWSDALAKGFKLPWSLAASSTSSRTGINMNQPAEYSCKSWTPDQSEFTVPASVSFTDISAYMKFGSPGAR